jgi:unsaturated rhamnogalacturonyl hydrolase
VNENGKFDTSKYKREVYELDNILPGRLLLFLYQQTGDIRYAKAADQLIDQLGHQPKTSDGGFWHKKVYTNQMWLDGIYMADVFMAQYASIFNKPQYFDEAAKQIGLIYNHTVDPKTGLLYHGWDENKNKVWANPQTGASPEFWGRALGWYIMALVDCLDYFPTNHPERNKILQIFKNLSSSIAKYQDTTAGLWYQVVDKGNLPDNWFESSCSAMFAYAFAKGFQKGYLGTGYQQRAVKAFNGLVSHDVYFDDQGKLYLNGTVKVGTLNPKVSKGDYEYYIGVDRRINDFKGMAAFFYLSLVLGK